MAQPCNAPGKGQDRPAGPFPFLLQSGGKARVVKIWYYSWRVSHTQFEVAERILDD